MGNDEKWGMRAVRVRVKVTKDPVAAGRFTKIGGQIGYKQKDGSWCNRRVDVWVSPETLRGRVFLKGDSFNVTGGYKESDREYNGKKYENRDIFAEVIEGDGRNVSNHGGTRDKAGFPTDAGGMDDVPF